MKTYEVRFFDPWNPAASFEECREFNRCWEAHEFYEGFDPDMKHHSKDMRLELEVVIDGADAETLLSKDFVK